MDKSVTVETEKMKEIGSNIKIINQGNLLILVIDTTKEIGVSSTGKMMGVASTGGFTLVPGEMKLNLYLGKKNTLPVIY